MHTCKVLYHESSKSTIIVIISLTVRKYYFMMMQHVPISFVKEHLHKLHTKEQIVKLQFGKKLWAVKLLCYSHASHFSSGWRLFREENKLQSGDACVFELINKKDVVFDVHIFRSAKQSINLQFCRSYHHQVKIYHSLSMQIGKRGVTRLVKLTMAQECDIIKKKHLRSVEYESLFYILLFCLLAIFLLHWIPYLFGRF